MKVKKGDIIASEMSPHAEIVCITKEWVIYKDTQSGTEFCNHKEDTEFWIPAEIEWVDEQFYEEVFCSPEFQILPLT